ncbi:MAG: hypothetical protein IKZ00_06645 [Bacteroidaceae bacterium]|nr:hypothetical protein [Bacteroidaceae bacterium]
MILHLHAPDGNRVGFGFNLAALSNILFFSFSVIDYPSICDKMKVLGVVISSTFERSSALHPLAVFFCVLLSGQWDRVSAHRKITRCILCIIPA